jgi:uncharacterized membrane protein YczE
MLVRVQASLPRRLVLCTVGCVVLGVGVAMLLTADLGSDGFSTLVNGTAISADIPFVAANAIVSAGFLLVAASRRLFPGFGTLIQVVVVGATAGVLLEVLPTPGHPVGQGALLLAAFPVLAVGIAVYLGAHLGAGPVEAAALAWDPPVRFKWTYGIAQAGGALGGWLLGATFGVGTIAVILLLGPTIDLASRLLRLDVHQGTGQPNPAR